MASIFNFRGGVGIISMCSGVGLNNRQIILILGGGAWSALFVLIDPCSQMLFNPASDTVPCMTL